MAGREEALQRARARRRPEYSAADAAIGATAALGATSLGGVAGYGIWHEPSLDQGLRKGLIRDELRERLPGYDVNFFSNDVGKHAGELTKILEPSDRIASYLGGGSNVSFDTANRTDLAGFKDVYGKSPDDVSKELRVSGLDSDQRLSRLQELLKDVPLDQTDWSITQFENSSLPRRGYPTATSIPEPGLDLGGFARGWSGPGENAVVYTAVPNANSGRFSQRLLPAMIDRVYGRDHPPYREPDLEAGLGGYERYGPPEVDIYGVRRQPEGGKLLEKGKWDEYSRGERAWLLDQMAPGQTSGSNVSAQVWGTEYEYPRYNYAETAVARVPGAANKSLGNPEIVVSEVRTPAELETNYLTTGRAANPYVKYEFDGKGNYAVGPSWGRSLQMGNPGNAAAVRRRGQTDGDISFRGDLIERRGGLSLADAQALQSKLGLPVVVPHDKMTPAAALEQAIESIREKEGLESHGAVIDRYARRLPNLGRTTAPRQPAQGLTYLSGVETAVQFPQAVQRAVDLPGALERAGLPPTPRSLDTVNTAAREAAKRRIRGLQGVGRALPVVGALSGFADPGVTGPLGAMTRTSDPGELLRLTGDAGRAYASSGLLGAGAGAALSAGLRGIASRAPVAATRLVAGGAAAAPALAVMGVADAADAYLQGATGAGLKQHWQSFQDQGTNRGAAQVLPELLPQARSVPANTSSGTARIVPTVAQNPVTRELKNRAALARRNFNPVRGDFGVSEVLFGRGGSGPRRPAASGSRPRPQPAQANPLQRAWGQLDRNVFGGWLPGGAARPGRGGRR
jgi:hypothetical protein